MSSAGPDRLHVVGIDPGVDIGVAHVERTRGGQERRKCFDTRDPVHLAEQIIAARPDKVAVEQFESSGSLSKFGKHTILVEGYLCWRLEEAGLLVVRQMPQKRYQCLDAAAEHFPLHEERHIKDALAHAYVCLKKEGWA